MSLARLFENLNTEFLLFTSHLFVLIFELIEQVAHHEELSRTFTIGCVRQLLKPDVCTETCSVCEINIITFNSLWHQYNFQDLNSSIAFLHKQCNKKFTFAEYNR